MPNTLSICFSAANPFFRAITLISILALPLISCQSTNNGPDKETTENLIETRIKIIQAKLDSGKPLEAQFEAEPLLKKFPKNAKILTVMGFSDLALKNNGRAIIHLKKAFEIQQTAAAALNLSSAYIAAKNYSKALSAVDKGIQLGENTNYPNMVRLHHNKGFIYAQKGQLTPAITEYKQALYYSPGYILTIKNLAEIYSKQGKSEEAKLLYQRYSYACSACYEPIEKLVMYNLKEKKFLTAKSLLTTFKTNSNTRKKDRIAAQRLLVRVERYQRSFTMKRKKENKRKLSMKQNRRTKKKNTRFKGQQKM